MKRKVMPQPQCPEANKYTLNPVATRAKTIRIINAIISLF
jgi:hypothetical protein